MSGSEHMAGVAGSFEQGIVSINLSHEFDVSCYFFLSLVSFLEKLIIKLD